MFKVRLVPAYRFGGGGLGGLSCVGVWVFEEFPVEGEGVLGFAGEFGGLGGLEKERRGFRGIGGEPGARGGEGLGGAFFGESGFEDFGDGGFVLGGGGLESGDAVVEGGGLGQGDEGEEEED